VIELLRKRFLEARQHTLLASTWSRVVWAAMPSAAWLVLLYAVLALRPAAPLLGAALWGLLLTWSFAAWGRVLLRALAPTVRAGWGLDGTLGAALTLSAGGALACVRLVSVTTVVLWAVAGVVLEASARFRVARAAPAAPTHSPRVRFALGQRLLVLWVALVGLSVLMGLSYLGSVANPDFNVWDDNMAYRSFARQFLDTGTLYEPFSYRRIGAYGGQSYLHAMVLALTDRDRLHIVDNGIAPLLLFGMILGYRRARWSSRLGGVAALVLLVTLPYTPHNLGSAFTGVLFFFGLFRVFDDPALEQAPKARALCVGLMAAAVCTLRQNYLSAAVLYAAFGYLAYLLTAADRRAWRTEVVYAAGATALFLLPWMLLSQLMVHTALYPVLRGNIRPDFGIQGSVTLGEELRWTWANLFTPKPIQALGLLFMAVFVLTPSRRSRALHALLFASMGAYVLMMHFFRTFSDADSIARYYLAFTVAFGLAATLKILDEVGVSRRGAPFLAASLCVATLALQLWNVREPLSGLFTKHLTSAETVFAHRGDALGNTTQDDLYRRLQDSVPAGAGLLVMLDHTYLLDGKRNPVFQYDHPGVMGPGGIPTFDGPEAWATYMLAHGVRFVAYQIGNSSVEYKRPMWDQRAAIVVPPTGRGGFYKLQALFELTSFDTLEALGKSRVNVFTEGDIHVIDLSARR
jgi:hypothetical protein